MCMNQQSGWSRLHRRSSHAHRHAHEPLNAHFNLFPFQNKRASLHCLCFPYSVFSPSPRPKVDKSSEVQRVSSSDLIRERTSWRSFIVHAVPGPWPWPVSASTMVTIAWSMELSIAAEPCEQCDNHGNAHGIAHGNVQVGSHRNVHGCDPS